MVTDVAVQKGTDAVLAAVGWRAGEKLNKAGKTQAPQNGLYRSTTGTVGSFTYAAPTGTGVVGTPGFGKVVNGTNVVGRTTLGDSAATGGPGIDRRDGRGRVEVQRRLRHRPARHRLAVDHPEATPCWTASTPPRTSALTWTEGHRRGPPRHPGHRHCAGRRQLGDLRPGHAVLVQPVGRDRPHLHDRHRRPGASSASRRSGRPRSTPLGRASRAANTQVIGNYFAGTSCAGLSLGLPACPLDPRAPAAHSTTHPDQHAGLLVPDRRRRRDPLRRQRRRRLQADRLRGRRGLLPERTGAGATTAVPRAGFLSTLQPYQAVGSKDGTIYAGLQDNGSIKILGQPGEEHRRVRPAGGHDRHHLRR